MTSISGELIAHVRHTLEISLQYALTKKGVHNGIIAYTPHAFPAYVCAIAAIEAFINEQLLGPTTRILFPNSSLWNIHGKALERLEIRLKVIIVPKLLMSVSFSAGEQPFQDFDTLVKVRNDIVHYKMNDRVPKYLKDLEQRGIALPCPESNNKVDYEWPSKVSTTEGIRWANNTVCKVVKHIVDSVPQEHKALFTHLAGNFRAIPDNYVADWFAKAGTP